MLVLKNSIAMALAFLTFVIFEVFIQTQGSHISFNVGYTPLRINEIACTAEKLKSNGGRYTCDYKGQVHCTEGWADDEPEEDANRCALPVCEPKCKPHGLCTSPNFCACEVGWDGAHCEICIPMPGCVHGQCRKETVLMGDTEVEIEVAQTCECEKFPEGHSKSGVHRFEGPKCDRPCCEPQCENDGWCVVPGDTTKSAGAADQGKCACPIGFSHSRSELENSTYTCSECMKAAGCKHGGCAKDENSNEIPGTCTCVEGFTGPLCDQLQCKSTGDIPQVIDCGDHGVCTADVSLSIAHLLNNE